LLSLSLQYPLQNWLGVNKKNIKIIKKLSIYENSLNLPFSIADIIKDGFKYQEISQEYHRRKIKWLKECC